MIAAYGDVRHSLVDRSRYAGPYLPGYQARLVDEDRVVQVRDGLVLPKALGIIVLVRLHEVLVRPQVDAEHVEHLRDE